MPKWLKLHAAIPVRSNTSGLTFAASAPPKRPGMAADTLDPSRTPYSNPSANTCLKDQTNISTTWLSFCGTSLKCYQHCLQSVEPLNPWAGRRKHLAEWQRVINADLLDFYLHNLSSFRAYTLIYAVSAWTVLSDPACIYPGWHSSRPSIPRND